MSKSQKRKNALEKKLHIYMGKKYIIRKMRIVVDP